MSKETLPSVDDQQLPSVPRSLQSALRKAKTRLADNDDVASESRDMELARLQLLADELHPMMQEIDENDRRFDFGITHGDKPRLWIDMTSFVAIGLDNTTYRFLKDTRMGRIVLAETSDKDRVADIVSDYVAERIVERERMLEGDWEALKSSNQAKALTLDEEEPSALVKSDAQPEEVKPRGFWGSFGWFLFGILCTILVVAGTLIALSPSAL